MKNNFLLLLALLTISIPSFCQTSDSVSYKNQIGIIGGQGGTIGIIYKRQVKPDAAWRFTQSGNYNSYANPTAQNNSDIFYTYKESGLYLQTLIGYEWQRQVGNKWTLLYGTDAGFGYGKNSSDYDFEDVRPTPGTFSTFQNYKASTQTYILKPMAGIKFDVNPRFYLALESSLSLNYIRKKDKTFETSFPEGQSEPVTKELRNANTRSFNMNFSPVSNIQLGYKF